MTEHRWQFSLRNLLIFTALLAAVIALAANQPRIASVCLLLAAPFLVGRAMPLVFLYAPGQARWIFAVISTAYSFACGGLCLRAFRVDEFDWRMWLALSALTAFGILCLCVAWAGPRKAAKNVNSSANGSV